MGTAEVVRPDPGRPHMGDWLLKDAFASTLRFPSCPQLSLLGFAEGQGCSARMGPAAQLRVGGKQDKRPLETRG